jgi:hypothetical protein
MHASSGFFFAKVEKVIIGYALTPHESKSREFTMNGIVSVPMIEGLLSMMLVLLPISI